MLRAAALWTQVSKMLQEPTAQKNFCQRYCFVSVLITSAKVKTALAIALGLLKTVNIKQQTLDLYEKNMAKYFHEFDLGKNFLKTVKEYLFKERLIN